mgnify:CR=1 FL=1
MNLGIILTLPSDNWLCKVDNYGKEQNGWDGTISASSLGTNIVISSLGRGSFCNPSDLDPQSTRYDPTHACATFEFYSKNNINLKIYKLNGQAREVFGMMTNGPSVSITWDGMETKDLTSIQRTDVFDILDSVKFTK